MTWLPIVRLVTFATVSLFAVIVMSISADLIAITEPLYFKFAALALATSLLTLLTVIPMVVIDMFRQGAIFSYIIVETAWLSVLWILWLSSGSYAAWYNQQLQQLFDLDTLEPICDSGDFDGGLFTQACQEIKVVMAFSFLAWIILMVYTGILLFLAIRAQNRGHNVWQKSVREDAIFYPEAKSGGTQAQVPTIAPSLPHLPQIYPPAPAPAPTPGAIQV